MKSANKVALVTGASAGMGKDIVKRLISEGFEVIAVARRLEQMDDLKSLGANTIKMDITKEEDILNVVDILKNKYGKIDVLMNNAGYTESGAVETIDIDTARRQFEVNLFGLARITQLIIPMMREQGYGKIINTTSIGGKIFAPLSAWYMASKHALEGWSDCLRMELSPFGIDVVIIEPGGIDTEFSDVMFDPLIKRGKGTVYEGITNKFVKMQKELIEKGEMSPASVITDLVIKAIKADKPKTRYAGGKYSTTMLFVRKYFSDRTFEKLISNMLK